MGAPDLVARNSVGEELSCLGIAQGHGQHLLLGLRRLEPALVNRVERRQAADEASKSQMRQQSVLEHKMNKRVKLLSPTIPASAETDSLRFIGAGLANNLRLWLDFNDLRVRSFVLNGARVTERKTTGRRSKEPSRSEARRPVAGGSRSSRARLTPAPGGIELSPPAAEVRPLWADLNQSFIPGTPSEDRRRPGCVPRSATGLRPMRRRRQHRRCPAAGPGDPSGVWAMIPASKSVASIPAEWVPSVSVRLGLTVFTRILRGPSSLASTPVIASTAPLEAV